MTFKISEAVKSLQKSREAAVSRLEQIENERKEIKASIKSLDAAIRALQPKQKASSTTPTQTDASLDESSSFQ